MSQDSATDRLTPLTIFIASPGDCASERSIVREVSRELEIVANDNGFTLKVRHWGQVIPAMGRPQQVILDQIPVKTWDVFVGLLWLRFGTTSGGANAITGESAESGTEEEFTLALESFKATGRPRVLFYRRTAGPPDISRLDLGQFHLVQEFFKKFEAGQPYEGLYKSYETTEDFRSIFRQNLLGLLIRSDKPTVVHIESDGAQYATVTAGIISAWRDRLLNSYDVLKLHRISSAYDAGSVLRADRDRVRLHDVFVPQHVCDVNAFVAERLPAPRDLTVADADELRLLGMQHYQELRNAKRHRVNDVLENENHRTIVFLGDPGAGKSSLLQQRALTWAHNPTAARALPLMLEMRQYADRVARARREHQSEPSLFVWAGELLGNAAGAEPLNEDAIIRGLSTSEMVLYCDALDEIFDSDLRRATAAQLLQLSKKIPGAKIVVSSRPVGYPDDILSPPAFSHWMVQEFDRKQIQIFLNKWVIAALPDQEDRINVTGRITSALYIKRVREMAGNPLLLTLMSILARTDELPRNRMRLFAKAAELLLYQWDTSRSLRPIRGLDFAYEQKHRVLRELAWRMQNAQLGLGGNLAPLEMVREVFDDELKLDLPLPGERARGVSLLLETLRVRDHVLCHLGGDRFAFVHRGFLEYFCADWLYERVRRVPSTAEEELFRIFQCNARTPSWGEVLGLGVLSLAPEVADPILARIEPVLMRRGTVPRWLSDATLVDEKTKSRYPKTAASLREKLLRSVDSLDGILIPGAAINQLTRFWPDEETRLFLTGVVNSEAHHRARRMAMTALTRIWPTEESRSILTRIAKRTQGKVCSTALTLLTQHWPDDETRDILIEVASKDEHSKETVTAVNQLGRFKKTDFITSALRSVADRDDSRKASRRARIVLTRWEAEDQNT